MTRNRGRLSRMMIATLAGLVSLAMPVRSDAHIQLTATLDAAQEVPAPTGVSSAAGGTATFTVGEDASGQTSLVYQITVHDLTGPAIADHIHLAPVGTAGNIVVPLDATTLMGARILDGTTVTPPTTVDDFLVALFDGGTYVNVHTTANSKGEIRGQIHLVKGECSCTASATPKAWKACVKGKIKALDKSEQKEDAVKLLKKLFKKASCGKTKGPKKAVACCLPQTPDENIISGRLCAPIPDKACNKIGGSINLGAGSSCFPKNPCKEAASPSGAFLD
jgi:CHRD domain-containing protein